MADNKEKVTEAKTEAKEEKIEKNVVETGLTFVDSYEDRRSTEDDADVVEEKSNVVYTNVPVDHIKGKSATSNREWHDFSTTWNYHDKGRDGKDVSVPLTIRYNYEKAFHEKYAGKAFNDLVKIIVGDAKKVPLDIVCSEYKDKTTGAVVKKYSPRLSYTTPRGIELFIPLVPYGKSDQVVWDLLMQELIMYGVLS